MQLFSGLIGKPDRAQRAFALRFDQASDDRQHFRQRRTSKNQLQNAKYSFAGEEDRFALRLFHARHRFYGRFRCLLHEFYFLGVNPLEGPIHSRALFLVY